MQVKIDLHLHSCVSPCADTDNTPCNVVNFASVNGTKIIALADHNCMENSEAAHEVGKQCGVLVIPAMEITTAEEIHALCLFRDFASAKEVQKLIHDSMPKYKVDYRIYNHQLVRNQQDQVVGEIDFLLNVACGYGIYELCDVVSGVNGVLIPAHIDRDSYSVLSVLGEVPADLPAKTLEISTVCPDEVSARYSNYRLIRSSDAHSLEQMCEVDFTLDLDEISIDAVINALMK